MPQQEPATRRITVVEAGEHWEQIVDAAARGEAPVVLERDGKAVAALISARDLARLRRYDAQREADFAVLDRIGAAFADVPYEELEREVAKALAEVRAEMRAEREQAEREQAAHGQAARPA